MNTDNVKDQEYIETLLQTLQAAESIRRRCQACIDSGIDAAPELNSVDEQIHTIRSILKNVFNLDM